MLRPTCVLFVLLSMLTLVRPASCQSTSPLPSDFAPTFSGDKHPLSLKLKDLDSSWRIVDVTNSTDLSNQIALYAALLTGGSEKRYFTQGETEALGGEVYLIAYHQPVKIDYAALMKSDSNNPPSIPKLTADTELALSLLNLRVVGSLNDIRPFSLADAINPPVPVPTASETEDASVSNLKQLGLGLLQYVQDYDEKLPPLKSAAVAKAAIYPYVKADAVFEQPSTHALYQPNTSLSHRSLASFNDPTSMVIYYEADPAADGLRAVLFLDGHVKRVTDADWQRLKTASHVPNPPQGVQ